MTCRVIPAIREGSPMSRIWSSPLNQFQHFEEFADGAIAVSEFFKMLELVQGGRPDTGHGRAFSDRRNYSTSHEQFLRQSDARLHRGTVGRWRCGGDNGFCLSGSVCSDRRPFRTCVRGRKGLVFSLLCDAAGWITAAGNTPAAADYRVSR